MQVSTSEKMPLHTLVTGSKATVVKTRNLSVPAGSFQKIATFKASDGVKAVTSSVVSDVSHSLQLYAQSEADDSSNNYGNDGSGAAAVQRKMLDRVNMKSTQIAIVFNNADTIAHVINADSIGWTN